MEGTRPHPHLRTRVGTRLGKFAGRAVIAVAAAVFVLLLLCLAVPVLMAECVGHLVGWAKDKTDPFPGQEGHPWYRW